MAAPIASLGSPVVYHVAAADLPEMGAEAGQSLPAILLTDAVDDADTVMDMLVFTRRGDIIPRLAIENGTDPGQWSVRETT